MIFQHTLRNAIHASGIGLHTGRKVRLSIRPAPSNHGICFVRTDLNPNITIPANVEHVVDSTLATTVGVGDASVSTIEHLMAAFAGFGVDNALVEVNAPEIPIMDGSAAPFVFLLQSAGLARQEELKRFLKIRKKIKVVDSRNQVRAELQPSEEFRIEFRIEYEHPVLSRHADHAVVEFSKTTFVKEVSRARTFGFLADYERLKSRNLALGGSLDNTLVVGDAAILNKGKLRLKDEFVKHKILDAVGDLYLLGHNLIGTFIGQRSGHTTNYQLVKTLGNTPNAWEYVTFNDAADLPSGYSGQYDDVGDDVAESVAVAV